jgi:predicted esterase
MINGIHHVTAICNNPQKILLSAGINDPIVSKTETENLYRLFQKTNSFKLIKLTKRNDREIHMY